MGFHVVTKHADLEEGPLEAGGSFYLGWGHPGGPRAVPGLPDLSGGQVGPDGAPKMPPESSLTLWALAVLFPNGGSSLMHCLMLNCVR